RGLEVTARPFQRRPQLSKRALDGDQRRVGSRALGRGPRAADLRAELLEPVLEPREGRRLLGRMFVLVGQCTFELTDSRAAGLELRLGGAPSAPLGVQALGQLALPKLQRGHPAVELGAL